MIKQSLLVVSIVLLVGCGGSSSSSSSTSTDSSSSSTSGKAGSRARYAVVGDYLYTVNSRVMDVLDISDPKEPQRVSKVHLPWDVETIFAYKNYLYIGAESGVYIYDNAEPMQPTSVAKFSHVQSCDPVVVSDDIAYVTLNSSSSCWRNETQTNRLEILDLQNPKKPTLIKRVDMWAPTGLGVDGNKLFICDGTSGLKAFEVTKKTEANSTSPSVSLTLKQSDASIDCYDVIAQDDTLIVSNKKEIRQFNYGTFPMEELGRVK